MNVPVALTLSDQPLNPKSTGEEIRAVLAFIAKTGSEPILLELQLRAVATDIKTSLKAVRRNYDMVLKSLNLKPVNLGLAIAKELLVSIHSGYEQSRVSSCMTNKNIQRTKEIRDRYLTVGQRK